MSERRCSTLPGNDSSHEYAFHVTNEEMNSSSLTLRVNAGFFWRAGAQIPWASATNKEWFRLRQDYYKSLRHPTECTAPCTPMAVRP